MRWMANQERVRLRNVQFLDYEWRRSLLFVPFVLAMASRSRPRTFSRKAKATSFGLKVKAIEGKGLTSLPVETACVRAKPPGEILC